MVRPVNDDGKLKAGDERVEVCDALSRRPPLDPEYVKEMERAARIERKHPGRKPRYCLWCHRMLDPGERPRSAYCNASCRRQYNRDSRKAKMSRF